MRRWVVAVLIVLGVALRLYEYLGHHSLSIDEAAIARNLIDRPWTKILAPLDYAQIAPPAFLLIEKAVVSTIGSGEFALRFFPLVCSLGSLWLCWAVSKRLMPFESAACALALFAINTSLIQYSSQVKPYSADVAAALLVVLVAIASGEKVWERVRGGSREGTNERASDRTSDGENPASIGVRRALWLGAIGASTAAFSFTAVFVLAGAAATCALFASRLRDARARRLQLVAPAVWMAAAAEGTLVGSSRLPANDAAYMQWFWASGFMPRSSSSIPWLWRQLQAIFAQTAHYRISLFWVFLAALGVCSFHLRRRTDAALLLIAPLLLVIAASAAHLYPFASGRVQLFLLPMLLMLVADGAGFCQRALAGRLGVVAAVPMALVLALAAYAAWTVPTARDRQEVKAFLEQVRKEWRTGDRIYVHYGTGQAFQYYAPRLGFSTGDYRLGTCSRGAGRTYLRELDQLRGHPRVWIVMSRAQDYEADVFLRYLDAIGTRLIPIAAAPSEAADARHDAEVGYLYDLTTSPRVAAVSADRFPLPELLSGNEPYPWSCYGVFQP